MYRHNVCCWCLFLVSGSGHFGTERIRHSLSPIGGQWSLRIIYWRAAQMTRTRCLPKTPRCLVKNTHFWAARNYDCCVRVSSVFGQRPHAQSVVNFGAITALTTRYLALRRDNARGGGIHWARSYMDGGSIAPARPVVSVTPINVMLWSRVEDEKRDTKAKVRTTLPLISKPA